jgi:ribosome-associated protein
MTEVKIFREPIELYKVLKLGSLASSGGEAKTAIAEGLVLVNGEVETRKRKKMMSGDVVKFNEQELRLVLAEKE